eukprot:Nitzschia sp. Nitz4//scaffold35_size145790//89712//91430//NITZ4_003036-RA/size145790-processed-gene-0.94-mRNA-1//-1//CDS//3329549142//901//frame0
MQGNNNNNNNKKPQHHVFLFRHCVRSTSDHVELHNNWTAVAEKTEHHYDVSDFVGEPMPYWNTPEYWCTKKGMDIMEGTGKFLYKRLVASVDQQSSGSGKKKIKFQVLADLSQRDVDTAYSLFRGLKEQAMNETINPDGRIELDGVHDLTYYRQLFEPWDIDEPVCEMPMTASGVFQTQMRQEIQKRVASLRAPEPGLNETLMRVFELGGSGDLGSILDVEKWIHGTGEDFFGAPPINTTAEFPVLSTDDWGYVAGPSNILAWFGQIAFYSRAGGVKEPFLPNATIPDVYKLIEWNYWFMSVFFADTTLAAALGSIMARGILDVLHNGHMHVPGSFNTPTIETQCDDGEDYDAKVTIIVGHDSDLASVSTALGLRWNLDEPYKTTPENANKHYTFTPPGSAMHFKRDTSTNVVEMSYLYPIFLRENEDVDMSGDLVETPLKLVPIDENSTTIDTSDISLSTDKKRTVLKEGLAILEAQIQSALDEFYYAKECYNSFVNTTEASLLTTELQRRAICQNEGSTPAANPSPAVPVLAVLLCVAAVLFGIRHVRIQNARKETYREVLEEYKGIELS